MVKNSFSGLCSFCNLRWLWEKLKIMQWLRRGYTFLLSNARSIYHSSWRTTASCPTALQSVSCAVEIVDYGKLKQFNNVFRIIQHVYLIINFVSTDYFISSKPRIICNSWVLTNYLEVWFLHNFKRFFMQRFMELSS